MRGLIDDGFHTVGAQVAVPRAVQAGHPLKPRTIQTALGELEDAGLAAGSEEGNGRARYWSPETPDRGAEEAERPQDPGGRPFDRPSS